MKDILWAPWRMGYVAGPAPEGCIFCTYPAAADDQGSLMVRRDEHAFAILNRYPYNNGHLMVAPYTHIADPGSLSEAETTGLWALVCDCLNALREVLKPDGFNVGMNLGRAAGAGYDEHLHVHIVPRWAGDSNFMVALAATKVLPQALEASWALLKEALGRRSR